MQVCRWGTYQSALACMQEGSKAAVSPVLTMTWSMRHPAEYRFAQRPSFARHHQLCRRRCRNRRSRGCRAMVSTCTASITASMWWPPEQTASVQARQRWTKRRSYRLAGRPCTTVPWGDRGR